MTPLRALARFVLLRKLRKEKDLGHETACRLAEKEAAVREMAVRLNERGGAASGERSSVGIRQVRYDTAMISARQGVLWIDAMAPLHRRFYWGGEGFVQDEGLLCKCRF